MKHNEYQTSSYGQKQSKNIKNIHSQTRINRLKQIDSIYKAQIQQIYNSKTKDPINNTIKQKQQKLRHSRNKFQIQNKLNINTLNTRQTKKYDDFDNISTSSRALQSVLSEQKIKSSRIMNIESSRHNDLMKMQIQNKDIKIRQLTSKCEFLLTKLKNHITNNQFTQEVQNLNKITDNKMQRFQNLYRIKNQQTIFKMKLQINSLLQEFHIPKEQMNQLNDIQTESSLFTFMTKKIKGQLKNFRIKQQETTFSNKKDKILNQKYEQRIHHLTQTSQLLKQSQSKLKQKNEQLKNQLNEYIQKIKQRELLIEQKQSQIFRLKKQNQQMNSYNNRLQLLEKKILSEKQENKIYYEMKQKQMKQNLANSIIQKQKLQALIEEKENIIEELMIKQKYVEQDNQRLNRELLRTKQRYQWYQKQLQNKQRQFNQEKQLMIEDFNKYKDINNQSLLLIARAETDEALRKVEEYQEAFAHLQIQLQQEKRNSMFKNQEYNKRVDSIEEQWSQKTRRIQKIREEELLELTKQYEDRLQELRKQFEDKENLLSEQIQSKMKALLAEKDKKMTERMMQYESINQELKRQIQSQKQLISMLQSKR